MNHSLAQIWIEHAEHRAQAIDIGERLEVLKDYPTPPNCTSPFAPIWINEMVSRPDVWTSVAGLVPRVPPQSDQRVMGLERAVMKLRPKIQHAFQFRERTFAGGGHRP